MKKISFRGYGEVDFHPNVSSLVKDHQQLRFRAVSFQRCHVNMTHPKKKNQVKIRMISEENSGLDIIVPVSAREVMAFKLKQEEGAESAVDTLVVEAEKLKLGYEFGHVHCFL